MGKKWQHLTIPKLENTSFTNTKNPILIHNMSIDRIVLFKASSGRNGFKNFIGSEDDSEKIMPLCVMVPKMNAYRRDFDEAKYMSVFI